MTQVLERENRYHSLFRALEDGLAGAEHPWLKKARASALARFCELGFPGEGNEDWRFTKTDPIARTAFVPAQGRLSSVAGLGSLLAHGDEAIRLVFIDGRFSSELSAVSALPRGVFIGSLAAALKADPARVRALLGAALGGGSAFSALNAAFFSDGALVDLPAETTLDRPVFLQFVSTAPTVPAMTHVRVVVAAAKGAGATIVEEYAAAGDGAYFTNVVSDITLAENAAVGHYKVQRESEAAFHVSSLSVGQGRDSRFEAHSFSLGGALVRNDVAVSLDGEGAQCALNGLYLARGAQHMDNHTLIEHKSPHGTSRELYKGVLDGSARAVFNGMISVSPAAQKTDAQVYNKNLLLSEQGLVNTKPEFKINANDVQCKHGATVGQLSADALFYLRSRGIGREESRRLLVYAFASEMIERAALEPLKEALAATVLERFHD